MFLQQLRDGRSQTMLTDNRKMFTRLFFLANRNAWPLSQSVGGVGFAALAMSHLAVQLKRR
jgi:hypothetical protein